jgi:hypothetical protein
MKISSHYQFSTIRKDLLKQSKARANSGSKPVYKVRGKAAKILEREIIKVKIRYGATLIGDSLGYWHCCNKPKCANCGEIGTIKYKLYQQQDQSSTPRIFKPQEGPHQVVTINRLGETPLYHHKAKSLKELEHLDRLRAQEEEEELQREIDEANRWARNYRQKWLEKLVEEGRKVANENRWKD